MDEFKRSLRRPFFYDMIMDNNDIYFSMVYYNALCRASLLDDQIEIINIFPNIPAYIGRRYIGVCKIKERLLLCSAEKEDDLLIYNISNGRFTKIITNKKFIFYSHQFFEYNEDFYIVCADTAEIVKIEAESLRMNTFDNHENILKDADIGMTVRLKNQIYIPVNKKKILLMFDLEKEDYESFPFQCNISRINSMCYYKHRFYTTGLDKRVYAWGIADEKAEEIAGIPNDVKSFYSGHVNFAHSLIYDNILFLFPCFADAILKINIFTGKTETLDIPGEEELAEEIDRELRNGRCFPAKYNIVQRQNEKVFFRSSKTRLLYELDLQTNEIIKHDLKIRNIYQNHIYPPARNGILFEDHYMEGLRVFIESLEEKVMDTGVPQEHKAGERIYKTVNG